MFLALDDVRDTVIDGTGVILNGTSSTTMLQLTNCSDLTVRGFVIDYDPLPFTQARIAAVGADGSWDVEVLGE